MMNWPLLRNSLLVTALATVLAVGFGLCVGVCALGLSSAWRRLLLGAAVVALALPAFLVTNCWLYLLGYTGVWRTWLPLNIYSLGGTVWVLALLLWPITLLAVWAAWRQIEPAQLEIEPSLRGVGLVRWLLWPVARPALAVAALATFVLASSNFAVPAIFQTKVLPAELWVRFSTNFDYAATLGVAWPLILAPLALLAWWRPRALPWPHLQGTAPARLCRQQLGAGWYGLSAGITFFVLALSVGLPLVQLLGSAKTWVEFTPALAAGHSAVWTSFYLAGLSATLILILGLAGARLPLGPVLWLPLLLPGVLLGVAFIFVFDRPAFGALYQSAAIVILALSVRYLVLGWTGAAQAKGSVDPRLTEAAVLEGASPWALLRHVHWPQMAPRLAATWYVLYLLCLWDVETILLIVPPGGETLALRVFNLLHYGHNSQVNALCLVLLLLALLPLVLWSGWVFISHRRPGLGRLSARLGRGGFGVQLSWVWPLAVIGFGLLSACSPRPSNSAPVPSRVFSRVEILGTRGTAPGQFNKPRSVAVDAQDNVYVVDMTGRVQKFAPDGAFLRLWQMPQTDLGKPKGMCRDAAGGVIVLEPHYSRVNDFSPEGQLRLQWGVHGTNVGQLAFPRAVIVNSHGEIWVSEYGLTERVQRFSPDGSHALGQLGRPGNGPGEFNRAEGLGLDLADRLYVADSCNHRIQIFGSDGRWLRQYGQAGTGKGELSYPYDVRVDAAGLQFVCEFGNSRIQVFDSEDHSLEILGGPGSAPGQFSNPWSIALDSKGNLYVADAGNHRVQKFVRRKLSSGPTAADHRPLPSEQVNPRATKTTALLLARLSHGPEAAPGVLMSLASDAASLAP